QPSRGQWLCRGETLPSQWRDRAGLAPVFPFQPCPRARHLSEHQYVVVEIKYTPNILCLSILSVENPSDKLILVFRNRQFCLSVLRRARANLRTTTKVHLFFYENGLRRKINALC